MDKVKCPTCGAIKIEDCTKVRGCIVEACDGEWPTAMHITPAIDDKCQHVWHYEIGEQGEEPTHCTKCGLSWTRYIFCVLP